MIKLMTKFGKGEDLVTPASKMIPHHPVLFSGNGTKFKTKFGLGSSRGLLMGSL